MVKQVNKASALCVLGLSALVAVAAPTAKTHGAGCSGLGEPSFFKDQLVLTKVTTKLQFNKALLQEKIEVKNSGGMITLSGNVSTQEQIALASQLTKEVNGVLCVNNFLQVGPPIREVDSGSQR